MKANSRPAISTTDIQGYTTTHLKVKEWTNALAPRTATHYLRALIMFEHSSHTQIEQLLDTLDNHTNTSVNLRELRSLIINSTDKLSPSVRMQVDSALRSFFKYFGHRLPTTTIRYETSETYRGYTKQELNALLGYLDKSHEKLFVVIGAECGLRPGTVLQLKYRHVNEDFNNRTNSIKIDLDRLFHIGRKKSGYTFIGTRSRELLQQCIEEELIKTEPETPLFTFSYGSILKMVQYAKSKAHLDAKIHPLHGLRYFFIDALTRLQPPIDSGIQNMLKGRFKDTDAKTYTNRSFDRLRPEYERAYPYLDYMNNAPEQTQQLSDQQTQLRDTIKQQNDRILLQGYQLKDLQEQLIPINQTLSALGDMFSPLLTGRFTKKAQEMPMRDALKEIIQQTVPVGKKLGQKPPPNFVDIATKGADSIPDQELQEIQELVGKGDMAAAFGKMTKYIPIELSQYHD